MWGNGGTVSDAITALEKRIILHTKNMSHKYLWVIRAVLYMCGGDCLGGNHLIGPSEFYRASVK